MLKALQALAVAHNDWVFVGTDVKNAFGTAMRVAALEAVNKLPPLAPALAQMWAPGPTHVHAQDCPTSWRHFLVHDGLFQGECLSTAAFCLLMQTVIVEFYSLLPPSVAAMVFVFAYVDDVVLVMPPEHLAVVWPLWDQCLSRVGLHLEHSKCHSWVPCASVTLPIVDDIVSQDLRGLAILGSAAEGEFESMLGPFAIHSEPLHKRVAAATKLAHSLCEMASVVLECASRQLIWLLLTRLLCHRLDFDARVLSLSDMEASAEQLDSLVLSVLYKLLPELSSLPSNYLKQLQLPGQHGGAFLTPVLDIATCAPLASFLQVHPLVVQTLQAFGLPEATEHISRHAATVSHAALLSLGASMPDVLGVAIDIDSPELLDT